MVCFFPRAWGNCVEIAALAPFVLGTAGSRCFAGHQVSSQHFTPALHPELSGDSGTQVLPRQWVISSRRLATASMAVVQR